MAEDPETALLNLPGIWSAFIHDKARKQTFLATDRLGVGWTYVVYRPSGVLFSSRFDVCAREVESRSVNMDALLSALELGYVPSSATVLEDVNLVPPGAVCEVRSTGLHVVNQRKPIYASRYAALDDTEKFQLLDRAYEQALNDWCPKVDHSYLISLSGGYDSRAVLGTAIAHGRKLGSASFGGPRIKDSDVARAVSRRLGVTHSTLQIPKPSWDDYARTFATSGGIGGTPFVQGWAENWMEFVRDKGDDLLIGFLGDSLSGSHAPRVEMQGWEEFWDEWSRDGGFAECSFVREDFRAEVIPATRRENARIPSAQVEADFQRVIHTDLYTRQRRCIGIQPYVIGRNVRPTPLFYHPSMLEFWANVGFEDVKKQRLYVSHLLDRFHSIFDDAKKPALAERVRGSAINAVVQAIPSLRPVLKPCTYNQTRLWCTFRDQVAVLFENHWDFLNTVFVGDDLLAELRAFPNSNVLTSMHLSRIVGVLILLDQVERGHDPAEEITERRGARSKRSILPT